MTSLTMEAWSPVVGGGAWVRLREPPPEVRTGPALGTAVAAQGATPVAAQPSGQQAAPQAVQPPPPDGAGRSGAAASAIRVVFTRSGGLPVVRTFLVGGG